MTFNSIKETSEKANEIFPTDYYENTVKRIVKEHNEKIDYYMNVTLPKELGCEDGKVNICDWFKAQELIGRMGFYHSAKAILDTLRAFGYDVKIDMQTNKLVY